MRIGIDLDNTLVCYDQLFWTLARERGVIDVAIPPRKEAIRDELRRRGLEAVWTALQGEAYGPRILDAAAFPGVQDALIEFRRLGWTVFVISHKTRTPIVGPDYDLHAAARSWLSAQNWLSEEAGLSEKPGFAIDAVFLELTKEDKLRRIVETGCDWFIDDLPELLTVPEFPPHVRRALFDPHRQAEPLPGIRAFHDWREAASLIAAETPQ